jgi:hypothetical protein
MGNTLEGANKEDSAMRGIPEQRGGDSWRARVYTGRQDRKVRWVSSGSTSSRPGKLTTSIRRSQLVL